MLERAEEVNKLDKVIVKVIKPDLQKAMDIEQLNLKEVFRCA